jgi:hypothetical protein
MTQRMDHFDEELELYALGMLEPDERDRVDEHVRTCDACAERLGRAESAVAALVGGAQQRRVRRLPAWPAAVAAAFALTSAVLFGQNVGLRGAVSNDGRVLDALVLSHFVHVPFTATTAAPVAAKVIYEQHGAWYQIVAERPADWRVTVTAADGTVRTVAERPEARGTASYLSLSVVGPVRTIELDDANGQPFALAHPVLAADRR